MIKKSCLSFHGLNNMTFTAGRVKVHFSHLGWNRMGNGSISSDGGVVFT